MRAFLRIFWTLLAAAAPHVAFAQSHTQVLQDVFDRVYPPGAQYAVIALNQAGLTQPLAPSPIMQNGPLPVTNADNYQSFIGLPNVHSEAHIAAQITALAGQYSTLHSGRPVTDVTVYSRLQPCVSCALALAPLLKANNWNGVIGFSEPYDRQTDADAYHGMNLLKAAGWSVVVNNGMAFQRSMFMCMMSKPIICQSCSSSKAAALQSLIDDGMDQVQSREKSRWIQYINATVFYRPGPDDATLKPAMYDCINSAQGPVGPRLR